MTKKLLTKHKCLTDLSAIEAKTVPVTLSYYFRKPFEKRFRKAITSNIVIDRMFQKKKGSSSTECSRITMDVLQIQNLM